MFAHYGGMAIALVYIIVIRALSILREHDWRFAAWSDGLVAVLLGVVSSTFTAESSVVLSGYLLHGISGAGLLLSWAIVFVARVEYERLRHTGNRRSTVRLRCSRTDWITYSSMIDRSIRRDSHRSTAQRNIHERILQL